MPRRPVALALIGLTVVSSTACGSKQRPPPSSDERELDAAAPNEPPSELGRLGSDADASPPAAEAGVPTCASTSQRAVALPLDLFVMLDASGSMNFASAPGVSKWRAVTSGLKDFIAAPSSSGIGVGLGVFPVKNPGTPPSCSSNADCAGFGRCFLRACDATGPSVAQSCDTSADCPGNAPCRELGVCQGGGLGSCFVGVPGACNGGTCVAVTTATCDGSQCVASDYDKPKVSIASLPGNAASLTAALDGLPTPSNDALTPTSAALVGGLAVARQHALGNPGHTVVLVLATDGLPTRCAPLDIPSIASLAAGGRSGSPSIKTFVIGVFASQEAATAKPNLDALAAGGGTSPALVVDATTNLAQDFQQALEKIRGTALPCEYAVPPATNGTPDFGKVNVEITLGGSKKQLSNVASAQNCAGGDGWTYDVDVSTGAVPGKLVLCPATCEALKRVADGTQVDILVGCKTLVK
jgi:hypothetical protein